MPRCAVDGGVLEDASVDPLVGTRISNFPVRERIGVGTTGAVYRVDAEEGGATVAMKILFGDLAANEEVVQRFLQSAEAASRIDHPNVVVPLYFGRAEHGTCFLIMPYVEGRTLETELASKAPVEPPRTAIIGRQLALALAAAHEQGCVHRDVKPSNVLLSKENGRTHARLVDFGLVALMAELPHHSELVGTPLYLAPEVARDAAKASSASDLYALGVVLYRMLAGHPPFDSDNTVDLIMKHTLESPPPLPESGGLELLVAWLLEKDPEKRPGSAALLAEEIERLGLIPDEEDDSPDDTLLPREAVEVQTGDDLPPVPAELASFQFREEEVVTDDLVPAAESLMPIVKPEFGSDAMLGFEFLRGRFDFVAEQIENAPVDATTRGHLTDRLKQLRQRLEPGATRGLYMDLAGALAELSRAIDDSLQ
ncbi:MAG: serine/threonine-protein kinase [Deltaproteobacteria bacterium]